MNLYPIITENWKIDGGACFSVVPKIIWEKAYPADEKNLITIVNRCLLIQTDERKILINTGMGNKQDEKFFQYYHIHGEDSLKKSLKKYGFSFDEITDVVLTHLHFDHCGGAVKYKLGNRETELVFPNAVHWVSKAQWDWANQPNPREKPSYFRENFHPIHEAGKLRFIEKEGQLFDNFHLLIVNGHTEGQLIPYFQYKGKTIVYMSDFIPSVAHIPLLYLLSFDIRPLLSMKEKEEFLQKALREDYILFFEHDLKYECCNLQLTEKGIRAKETFSLWEYLIERLKD